MEFEDQITKFKSAQISAKIREDVLTLGYHELSKRIVALTDSNADLRRENENLRDVCNDLRATISALNRKHGFDEREREINKEIQSSRADVICMIQGVKQRPCYCFLLSIHVYVLQVHESSP